MSLSLSGNQAFEEPVTLARRRWVAANHNNARPKCRNPYYQLLFAHHPYPLDDEFVALAGEFYGAALRCKE